MGVGQLWETTMWHVGHLGPAPDFGSGENRRPSKITWLPPGFVLRSSELSDLVTILFAVQTTAFKSGKLRNIPCCGLAPWHPNCPPGSLRALWLPGLEKNAYVDRWVKFPSMVRHYISSFMQDLSHFIIVLHSCSCIIQELRLICASMVFVVELRSSKCKRVLV